MLEIASVVGGIGAALTAVIAIVLAAQLRNRERRLALVDLHISLTTSETAEARDVIGTLIYGRGLAGRARKQDAISAYFKLIWALQRARNVYIVYGFDWGQERRSLRRRLVSSSREREARNLLTWNVTEIADNVALFHANYAEKWDIEDDDAWRDIAPYLYLVQTRRPPRVMN